MENGPRNFPLCGNSPYQSILPIIAKAILYQTKDAKNNTLFPPAAYVDAFLLTEGFGFSFGTEGCDLDWAFLVRPSFHPASVLSFE